MGAQNAFAGDPSVCEESPDSDACMCELEPGQEGCFCILNPSDSSCIPEACQEDPSSEECVCELNPADPTCVPSFCELEPDSVKCFCEQNPSTLQCVNSPCLLQPDSDECFALEELCLENPQAVECPLRDGPVGGNILPIETTSLLLANAQSFSWMIPVILSGIGIGLFVVSRKSENS